MQASCRFSRLLNPDTAPSRPSLPVATVTSFTRFTRQSLRKNDVSACQPRAGRFTPVQVVDQTNEKEWANSIGLLDWEDTNIIFTKKSLLEFLKYTGVTVDHNCKNIAQLPRFAQFGKITTGSSISSVSGQSQASGSGASPLPSPASESPPVQPIPIPGGFRPTRRVRAQPGGQQTINLFGDESIDVPMGSSPTDTFREAVRPSPPAPKYPPPAPDTTPLEDEPEPEPIKPTVPYMKPSRRVRAEPGGPSSLGDMFGN